MTREYDADLDPSLSAQERDELLFLAARLAHERPLIAPAVRGDVRRRLAGQAPAWRPVRLWRTVATTAAAGVLLLAAAAANLAGLGPLAPDRVDDAANVAQVLAPPPRGD